jgi:hypothetical protein
MDDLLVRAVLAAPLAILLPFGIPRLRSRLARTGAALLVLCPALAVHLDTWEGWAMLVASTGFVLGAPGRWYDEREQIPIAAAVAVAALAVAVTDVSSAGDALSDVAESRDVAIAVAGWLGCVLLGGAVIGRVMHPFAARVSEATPGMEDAGRYIGWLERSLLYGLILLGSADAAALVVAAKSVARFPSFSSEKFAEYYLIGSLLSLLIAAGCGIAVRAAIGLPLEP